MGVSVLFVIHDAPSLAGLQNMAAALLLPSIVPPSPASAVRSGLVGHLEEPLLFK